MLLTARNAILGQNQKTAQSLLKREFPGNHLYGCPSVGAFRTAMRETPTWLFEETFLEDFASSGRNAGNRVTLGNSLCNYERNWDLWDRA